METNLNEIGVDSIVMMQFIVLIEENFVVIWEVYSLIEDGE